MRATNPGAKTVAGAASGRHVGVSRRGRCVVVEAHPVRIEPLVGLNVCESNLVGAEGLDAGAFNPRLELVPERLDPLLEFLSLLGPGGTSSLRMRHSDEKVALVRRLIWKLVERRQAKIDALDSLAVRLEELLPVFQLGAPAKIEGRRESSSNVPLREPLRD